MPFFALLWPKVSGADGLTGWAWCSAVTKGQWSWWVDWMRLMLRCDQRSVELMGWLGELDARLWPKVSLADGLTGWDWCSAVTKGQWSWWVDWVRHCCPSSVCRRLSSFTVLFCQVKSDFDESYKWYEGMGLQSYRVNFENLHKTYAN